MHVLQFLKLGHSAPPGGRLNFGKNTEFDCSDLDMWGWRFHRNCMVEFNETWTCLDQSSIETVRQNSMRLEETIVSRRCSYCMFFNYWNWVILQPLVEDWTVAKEFEIGCTDCNVLHKCQPSLTGSLSSSLDLVTNGILNEFNVFCSHHSG